MRITIIAFAVACLSGAAFAADPAKKTPSPAQQAQQERMRDCNAQAKEKALKGDERKSFMSGCLKADKK